MKKNMWIALFVAISQLAEAGEDVLMKIQDTNLKPVGTIQCQTSREIASSPVSIGFECLDRELFDPEKCYGPLGRTGVKWARCQTGWSRCEKSRGVYDFAWLDRVVDRLQEEKIQPWFNVGYGNSLYMNNLYSSAAVGCVPFYYGDEALNAWKNYIRAMAKHFKGRVRHFEIWNEPNLTGFWQPKNPAPLEYAKLIRLTGKIIREEIPDAKIGACVSGTYSWFSSKLLDSGIASELSFFSVHHYCIQPELNYRKDMEALRRLLDANGGKHVNLWQGESGYASWFPPHHWLNVYQTQSERNQAVWMLRRYVVDRSLNLQLSSFFHMADMMMNKEYVIGDEVRPKPARQGILNGDDYSPKISFTTMKHVAALMNFDTIPVDFFAAVELKKAYPQTVRTSRLVDLGVVCYTFCRNGYPAIVYYLAEDPQFGFPGVGNVTLSAHAPDLPRHIENPVLVDLLSGKVYAVIGASLQGDRWMYFSNLPLTDYPLLLTDRKALRLVE